MSSSSAQLLYIGDEPAQVARLSGQLTEAGRSISKVAQSLSLARGNIDAAWTSDAKDLCDRDVGLLVDGLPRLTTGLGTAHAAVDRYQLALLAGRTDVDELRARYDHANARIEQSVSTINALVGSTRPADIATADTENAVIRAAGNTLAEVRADYQALLTRLTAIATETQTALINSWNPTGQPTGTGAQAAGLMLLNQGGMGGTNLGVLHFSQMDQLAEQAQADLDGINEAALSPEERNARIQSVLQNYSQLADDPAFATALADRLGQDYFRDLQSDLGTYQHFWGAQQGNENYRLDSSLFTLSATVLAHATDPSQTWQVSDAWLTDLTHDEHGGVQPGWVVTASDYLRVGVPFPSSYLDSVGQAGIDWEKSRPEGSGDPWQDYGYQRFTGNQPFSDPPATGAADPLKAILDQYTDHPDATSTLFASGPLDPATGRAADPASGNLMWLLHRRWDGDGANELGNLLDTMTNPGQYGDKTAAGDVAYNVITAVSLGDDGLGRPLPQGMPGDLPDDVRDSVANITARYMGSIIGAVGGQPATNGEYSSGLPTETGTVARVDFGIPNQVTVHGDLVQNATVPKALSWLYADTENHAIRETLYSGWLTSSGIGAAQDLQQAQAAHRLGDAGLYGRQVLEFRDHTAASAQVYGLMTETDVKSFGDSDAAAASKVDEVRGGVKAVLAVGKEIVGLTGVPGRIVSAGLGIFNNMLVDDVVPTRVAEAADNYNAASQAAEGSLRHLSSSVVASMSHLGLPVLTEVDPVTGVVLGQTAVVDPASSPDYRLFTDASGQLLPYDEIYEPGPDFFERTTAFEQWYGGTPLFGDTSGPRDYEGEVLDAYNAGLAQAQH